MAFRKRNAAVGTGSRDQQQQQPSIINSPSGVRPSSLSSQPVTSSGTASLDALLGGHGGLALGSSLLIEESGTTDFAGALVKYYAAEGVCQGHVVHVLGCGDGWVRELPGVAEDRSSSRKETLPADAERMKIAWRYESLGASGDRDRGRSLHCKLAMKVHSYHPLCLSLPFSN
jgi:elongator complex protein 4